MYSKTSPKMKKEHMETEQKEQVEMIEEGFKLDQGCVLSWVVLLFVGLFVMQ